MDRLDDARTRDERAEDDEHEGERRREERPALHHVALAVDREAVDHGDGDEPGEQARVLDRVPSPVAAPAEHDVGPHRAQADAHRQEDEGEQRDAVAQLDPALGRVVAHQGGDGVGERDRHACVADEQGRRVQDHRPVLEQHVHAPRRRDADQLAVVADVGRVGQQEGVVARGEQHDRHEEEQDDHRHRQGDAREPVGLAAAVPRDPRRKDGDEEAPGQKGPGAARPQPRELVEPEERPGVLGVVLGDVLDRDVMGKKALDDDGAAHEDRQRRDEDEHVAEVRERLGARRALLAGAHGRLPHPGRRRRARQMPRDQAHNRRHRGGEAHPERRLANVSQRV